MTAIASISEAAHAPVDLKRTARKTTPARRPVTPDRLPPHSIEAEQGVLGCLLLSPALLNEMDKKDCKVFYDLRHQTIFNEMVAMFHAAEVIDLITFSQRLKDKKLLENIGGRKYLSELPDATPSAENFTYYLDIVREKARLRRTVQTCTDIVARIYDHTGEVNGLFEELEKQVSASHQKESERPVIEIVTVDDILAYVPEPKTFLVGADMISLSELTVIAGLPGLGKSRLANTLAFAGARGAGDWMGYVVRRQWRTLILQSENSMRRMQSEVKELPEAHRPFVRFCKPASLMFSDRDYRDFVRRYFDEWPFDMLIIDPWSDVVRDEKFSDYQEGLENIMASLPGGEQRPAIVIVAHLKKTVLGDKRMRGRQLMGQVSGSMRLMQKARTAFMLQPGSDDTNDPVVIFDCGKCNNDTPLDMAAFVRCNGAFLPSAGFDFDEWLNPDPERGRKTITVETMERLFANGRRASKKILVEELKGLGFSQPNAYRALDDGPHGKFHESLTVNDGLLGWKG